MARVENLTVMFVDMVGFADRTSRQSREQNKALLRAFNGLLVPLVARFGGRRVKSIGDALLVTFRSPTDSVRCSMAMHDAVASYNHQNAALEPIRIRVALNVGEVRIEDGDVFGEAVNIAARVEELTPPGEIYLTGVVYLSMNKAEVPSEHVAERELRGVPEPVRLFRVPPYKLTRLTAVNESLDTAPGELPFGGMHVLPADSALLTRVVDSLRRAPYVDWPALFRAMPRRTMLVGVGVAMGVAVLSIAAIWLGLTASDPRPMTRVAINEAAREALNVAHSTYLARRRTDSVSLYAKALSLEPSLRHDSGLAANLVNTLGAAGEAAAAVIRQHRSPELINELGRRTTLPGRKGAHWAAKLLTEFGESERIDRRMLATTDLAEAPTCRQRLAALRSLRKMGDPRALPALREATKRSLALFREDQNECLHREAELAIAELDKIAAQ